MQRFTTSVLTTQGRCLQYQVTVGRRMLSLRVGASPNSNRYGAGAVWSSARWYQYPPYYSSQQQQYQQGGNAPESSAQSGGQQQPGGYYQPPPPPQYMSMPPPPPPQILIVPQAAGGGGQGHTTLVNGDLGTKERPLYIMSPPQPASFWSIAWFIIFLIIGVSAMLHIAEEFDMRSGDGKTGDGLGQGRLASMFGSTEVKPVDLDSKVVTFADVQGCDEAKAELQEIVNFLKDPAKFQALGARLPRGALLVGPPGTGKTMLAKAIAKEAGVKFYFASGSEFDEMFVGVGARRVRELFAAARANGPALIFIDEIDALGGKRSNKDQSYSRMTLNQLLSEMDGFDTTDEVIVLAATNTPGSLDKALTRPGRFDTTISVDPPDMKGREAIAETYLKKVKKDATVRAKDIARGTTGFTGAELSNLINIAAIRAAVLGKPAISAAEVDYAKDRVLMGAANTTKIIPEEEKKVTAYHEGGHALVAILLENAGAEPVHKATIIPRGSGIMGLVQQQPKHDRYSQSKKQILARLQVCLAGRIAEEILLGADEVTTGASSDFQQATGMARRMVRQFGFNDGLGTIDYESAESAEGAWLSDSTKQRIEHEVQTIVQTAYKDAHTLLMTNRSKLDVLAQNLLKYETLTGEQMKALIEGRPMPEAFSFADHAAAGDSGAANTSSKAAAGL